MARIPNIVSSLKVWTVCLFLLGALGLSAGDGGKPTKPEKAKQQTEVKAPAKEGLVNINTATAAELDTLPRIGPAIAARIIAFRTEHGGFKSLEELMNVSGIGEKTFERLKDHIRL